MFERIDYTDHTPDFSADLARIKEIKKKFSHVLHSIEEPQDHIRSYDPVLDYYNYEKFGQNDPANFRSHTQTQLETYLGERLGVTKNTAEFIKKPDGVYCKAFPNEPFDHVLMRGIIYRRDHGSKDQARENEELVGWQKIYSELFYDELSNQKPLLGSKFIVVSGPGLAEGTDYPNNYIDVYELKMDFCEKKRFIQRRRYISAISYTDYINEIKLHNPDYFKGFSGSLDAWFLGHPLFIDQKTKNTPFADLFSEPQSKTPESEFDQIIADCMPFIHAYISLLCVPEKDLNPEAIYKAYNAILVLAGISKTPLQEEAVPQKTIYANSDIDIRSRIDYLNRFEVQDVLAGCGLSGSFKLNQNPSVNLFVNSVARYGINSNGSELPTSFNEIKDCINCPFCNQTVKAGIKDGVIYCFNCKAHAPWTEDKAA